MIELENGVYWVGVVDWELKQFHGHELSTHRGSSYNSYLIIDEKVTLVDTVWTPFKDRLIHNIKEIIDPSKIDVVVANHAEIDHSGSLPEIMKLAPRATVVVSQRGRESIEGHFHEPWAFQTVKTGDTINLGKHDLVFIEAPMLHWPDSMFTYMTGKNILMSNDAFGQHYATAYRFNDQVDNAELYEEAIKYYANILTPFSPLVTKKINEVLSLNLPVDMIAPSHGVIWRDNPLQIVEQYKRWASQKPGKCIVIIYDTMWYGTRQMAEAIGNGVAAEGVQYKLFNASITDRNDLVTEIFEAGAVIIGSPTFNQGVLPTLMPILEDIRGLKFKNKVGAAFGSYGWSGESITLIEEHLKKCGIQIVSDGVRSKWQPREEDLASCQKQGQEVARVIKALPE